MFIKYYDNRFGDFYEIYANDETGEFEMAVRSVGEVGRDSIYYDRLSDIPPYHRNQIEHIIWQKLHPSSNDQHK
jgi:hypothetical protein